MQVWPVKPEVFEEEKTHAKIRCSFKSKSRLKRQILKSSVFGASVTSFVQWEFYLLPPSAL